MKHKLLFLLLLSISFSIYSQHLDRQLVHGKVVIESKELEGITVFNLTANKGTLTNKDGEFDIRVRLNDTIRFGALQFKDFDAIISEKVIKSKRMTVYLLEQVNELDEVVILPYDLTGDLELDTESVRIFRPNIEAIKFGIQHLEDYEFSDDNRSKIENIAMHSQSQPRFVNGLNVGNILGMMLKPLFGKKKKKKYVEQTEGFAINRLKDHYSEKFLMDYFKIPSNKINEFIAFAEEQGLDYSLLKSGKEMDFLEFLTQKSQLFLLLQNDDD